MDGIQVGLLGADRSDGADTVLVSAAEGKNSVIALQSVLQEKEEAHIAMKKSSKLQPSPKKIKAL